MYIEQVLSSIFLQIHPIVIWAIVFHMWLDLGPYFEYITIKKAFIFVPPQINQKKIFLVESVITITTRYPAYFKRALRKTCSKAVTYVVVNEASIKTCLIWKLFSPLLLDGAFRGHHEFWLLCSTTFQLASGYYTQVVLAEFLALKMPPYYIIWCFLTFPTESPTFVVIYLQPLLFRNLMGPRPNFQRQPN